VTNRYHCANKCERAEREESQTAKLAYFVGLPVSLDGFQEMTCSYCGSRNSETEHRCRRCGRRPGDTLNEEVTLHRTTGALATKPRPTAIVDRAPAERPFIAPNLAGAVQGSLFNPNVISMPPRGTARPPRPKVAPSATTATAAKPATRKAPRGVAEGQGQLEFLAPEQSKPRTLGTTVEARIYCEAPVATPIHRALAAALDWTMILIGYGLFLLTFLMCGGELIINRPTLLVLGGTLAVLACAYGLFWAIVGTESFGMRWTHLRLITFDGFTPERWQRALRFGGSCLSLFSVLGAFWSFADEEGLGWQDHMSRTFPTAHELESRVFRRH
jgi:uncharacterized RDD family membrane protein YckC